MRRTLAILMFVATVLGFGSNATATPLLIDRGGGLIYDPVLKITWLQNTNLAGTAFNSWTSAMSWASNLVYQGYSDWRLPTSPATQQGWVNEGEMGHLYYTTLGNTAFNASPNVGPFLNIVSTNGVFWMGAAPVHPGSAWAFEFHTPLSGFQNAWSEFNTAYAWAVRDGDSSPVPEPGSTVLVATGIASVLALRRRRRRS